MLFLANNFTVRKCYSKIYYSRLYYSEMPIYKKNIEYKKFLDSIDRDALRKVLEHFEIKGNMLATLKSFRLE